MADVTISITVPEAVIPLVQEVTDYWNSQQPRGDPTLTAKQLLVHVYREFAVSILAQKRESEDYTQRQSYVDQAKTDLEGVS